MANLAVVVPAGGLRTRFGGPAPKQFLRFGAATILAVTVRHFAAHRSVSAIVVAAPERYVTRARRVLTPPRRPAPPPGVARGGPPPHPLSRPVRRPAPAAPRLRCAPRAP